jgi:hypothetical protein
MSIGQICPVCCGAHKSLKNSTFYRDDLERRGLMPVGFFKKVDVGGVKVTSNMVPWFSFRSSPEVVFISGLYVVNMNHYILNKLI